MSFQVDGLAAIASRQHSVSPFDAICPIDGSLTEAFRACSAPMLGGVVYWSITDSCPEGVIAPSLRASKRWHKGCVRTCVGKYGAVSSAVEYVIRRAGELTVDEAADLYHARATRLLIDGHAADKHARLKAERTALRMGCLPEYEEARHLAASAWRRALPEVQGPWLVVGSAIANAAGALIVAEMLDQKDLALLLGPWRQAIGTMVPVGPGHGSRERSQALVR